MKYFANLFIITAFTAGSIANALGPGSSGGGNGIGNAPIESYAFDPAQEPEAGALYKAAIQIFTRNAPCAGLSVSEFFRSLSWYKVPGRFSELPNTLTGLPFASEQIAIQNFDTREIWIDLAAYQRMSPTGKATLLLHESALALIGSEVQFQRKHKTEEQVKQLIMFAEAYVRKGTSYFMNPQNQKKDRLSYLEGLNAIGIPAGNDDFWCSNVIEAKNIQGPDFSSECAEITDVNTHEKFQLDAGSAMYKATWEMKDPTAGKGQVCHQQSPNRSGEESHEPKQVGEDSRLLPGRKPNHP